MKGAGGSVNVKVSEIPAVREDFQGEDYRTPGDISYWHYGCDGFDDRGWGCGYRTVQTICDYIRARRCSSVGEGQKEGPTVAEVPSLAEIQQLLVEAGDKPAKFSGSREWIGTFEAFLIIDRLFDVPCKIVHVREGRKLSDHLPEIVNHFRKPSPCPVMMGGDADAASKCVLGVAKDSVGNDSPHHLLIADPHMWSPGESKNGLDKILEQGWISWKNIDSGFVDSSMYNLCLPQLQ